MKTCASVLFLLLAAGCSATVTSDGGDGGGGTTSTGGGGCGDAPPPSDGYCAPTWVCSDGAWIEAPTPCPEPTCPQTEPAQGDSCDVIGQQCTYETEFDCGGSDLAECTEQGWDIYTAFCEPAPVCPDDAPIAGTSCAEWPEAYDCYYSTPSFCGDFELYVYCDGSAWSVSLETTCGGCEYDAAAGCEADTACRWAVPGCGDNPIPAEGCYPDDGCGVSGCAADKTCTTVAVDPCWDQPCDACSEPFDVCLPSTQG